MKNLFSFLICILMALPANSGSFDDVSMRALGMGGCYVALRDTADPGVTNPASLSDLRTSSLSSLYTKLQTDTELHYLSYCQPLFNGAFGISWIHSCLPDIMRTASVSGEPEVIGNFFYYSNEYSISYGRRISDGFSGGISIKYASSGLPGLIGKNGSSFGHSASAGLLFYPNDCISFGVKIDDIYGTHYWSTGYVEHDPPVLTIGGASYVPFFGHRLLFVQDISRIIDADNHVKARFGAELSVGNIIIRAGCGDRFTAGFGVTKGNIELNYAYEDKRILSAENVHRVSLTYYW